MKDGSDLILRLTVLDYVASNVDQVFKSHVDLVEKAGVRVAARLIEHQKHAEDGPKKAISMLLLNAMTSLMAAYELVRRGFPLQVGILVRNSIEVMAMAVVINSDRQAYEKFQHHKLDSSACIGMVKKTWPEIGVGLAKTWGDLSNQFVHVGILYRRWQLTSTDLTSEELFKLGTALLSIKVALHNLDLISELVCYQYEGQPRFWKRLEANKYLYNPTIEGKDWMESFFKDPCKDIPDTEVQASPTSNDAKTP